MSIATKRGDEGMTDLMFGRRVSKTDSRVEACGTFDELNAALGMSRVWASKTLVREEIPRIQEELITLMGELATLEEDLPKYREKGKQVISGETVSRLDDLVRKLEEEYGIRYSHWAMPGGSDKAGAACLDLARTVARRGERVVIGLLDGMVIRNREIVRYLNRLSDVIWLLARFEERG